MEFSIGIKPLFFIGNFIIYGSYKNFVFLSKILKFLVVANFSSSYFAVKYSGRDDTIASRAIDRMADQTRAAEVESS